MTEPIVMPPHQRPQSAAAWREVVEGRASVPPPQAAPPRPAPPRPAPAAPLDIEFADTVQALPEDLRPRPSPAAPQPVAAQPAPRRTSWLVAAAVLALVLLGLFVVQLRGNMAKQAPPAAEATQETKPT